MKILKNILDINKKTFSQFSLPVIKKNFLSSVSFNFHNLGNYQKFYNRDNTYSFKNESNNYLYKQNSFNFVKINKPFKVISSKDSNKSQRGIFHLKRDSVGFKKCFSMKHHKRKFVVNTARPRLHSDILNRDLYILVSTSALKVIKLYGGIDNYLLKSKHSVIKDSQYATYLKKIIKHTLLKNQSKEAKDTQVKMLGLKNTNKPKSYKLNIRKYKNREIPSIYIPVETLKTDYSEIIYPSDKFISRTEHERINQINQELELTTDNERKNELRDELTRLKKEEPERVQLEVLKLQPIRHLDIKDEFVRIRNNLKAKIRYIDLLKKAENFAKIILADKYKHYSEDYPETQLILQQTELQKQLKEQKNINRIKFSSFSKDFEDTSVLEKNPYEFNPYGGKQGRVSVYDNKLNKTKKLAKEYLEREKEQRQRRGKRNKSKSSKENSNRSNSRNKGNDKETINANFNKQQKQEKFIDV